MTAPSRALVAALVLIGLSGFATARSSRPTLPFGNKWELRDLGTLEAGINLTNPPPEHLRASADIVTVGGVFTVGHIAPEALAVMASLVRPGGLLVVSTRAAYLEQTNFREVVSGLIADDVLRLLVHFEKAPYTMDSTGDYWAFAVPGEDEP